MMKILLISALFVCFTSCQNNCEKEKEVASTEACSAPANSENTDSPVQQPSTEVDGEVPDAALIFDANIKFVDFEASDEVKLNKAIEIIKKVIATNEFRTRVLNFTYKQKLAFVDNGGFSNAQVYQKLLDGAETLRPVIDHTMDLELQLYHASNTTVGYTYPSSVRIWMNTKYFDQYTPSEVARNVFHEWTHKLGFTHAVRATKDRKYSVPYALGSLIEELGKKYE